MGVADGVVRFGNARVCDAEMKYSIYCLANRRKVCGLYTAQLECAAGRVRPFSEWQAVFCRRPRFPTYLWSI